MAHDPNTIRDNLASGFFGFWVNNWRVSFLVIGLIIFLGIFSLLNLPKESNPQIEFGIIQVRTPYLGVNPVDMDTLITEDIEEAVDDIEGIKKIQSSSRVGLATTTIELYNDVNTQDVLVKIRDEVDKVTLPEGAEDPIVTEISEGNQAMFQLLIYGDEATFPKARLKELARKVKNQLEGEHGIASIRIEGSAEYDLHVLLDRAKMEELGVTIGQVGSTVRSFNQNQPLGNYTVDGLSYDFRIEGELTSQDELLSLPIITDGFTTITLADIATVERDYDDEQVRKLGLYQERGYNSVTLTFNKRDGASIFSSAKQTKQAITKIFQTQEFAGAAHLYSSDLSEMIQDDYQTLSRSGLQTLIFVFLTLIIFVGLKEAGIATLAIPMAFLVTFIALDQLGLTLNFLTNFSLILTLGIAIDTTIVIIEAAYERLKIGYNPKSAILLAVKDFKRPLIAGTSTTLVVFIPMMMLPGVIGKFLAYIPITVFATLIAALFIALTINSALFYKLSKKKKKYITGEGFEKFLTDRERTLLEEERQGKEAKTAAAMSFRERMLDNLNNWYENTLSKFIQKRYNRLLSIFVPLGLLILTFVFLSPRIGFTLFPAGDNERFDLTVETEVGSTTEETAARVPYLEGTLSEVPELDLYNIRVDDNTMNITVELTDKDLRASEGQRDVFAVEQSVLEDLRFLEQEGLRVESAVLAGGPPQGSPVGIKLMAESNEQFNQLVDVAKDFEAYLRTIEGTKNVGITSEDSSGQFVFTFDREKLSSLGLTPNDLIGEISSALNGFPAGSMKINEQDIEIKLLFSEFAEAVSPSQIQDLIVTTSKGPVRVGEVIDYNLDKAVSTIAREDTNITIRVQSDLDEAYSNQGRAIQSEFMEFARGYEMPAGISFEAGGEGQENADLIAATGRGFLIALFLIFVILVLQFNSFAQPSIILYSVVLAMLGVNIGLFVTGNPYSMPFAIGFIALTGIVVNDAIILIDRINDNISHKIDVFDAIIEAARSRLQPIILTTVTTLLGVLPISLQDKFWEGLGFTMIFGLFAGSAMTLFVIPSLYYMFFVRKNGTPTSKTK